MSTLRAIPNFTILPVILFILALMAPLAGCTQKSSTPETKSAGASQNLKKGMNLFQFDYEAVTELLLVKSDPASGDRWSARFSRPDPKSVHWQVQSEGIGAAALDHEADGYFILHLLDTLRTLAVAQSDRPGTQESMGLAPPRYALQWKAGNENFEIRLGAPGPDPGSVYAWIPNQPLFTAQGATLQMLDFVKDFTSLRLKTWASLTSDDVDEIELKNLAHGPKPVFYAQREGADWTDRSHHSVRGDVPAWLEALTHSRVKEFIDDPSQARALRTQVEKAPLRQAVLTDRHGKAVLLQLAWVQRGRKKQLVGLSSARPEGVFEIYPESVRFLEPPR
jgi:hypothetical protein